MQTVNGLLKNPFDAIYFAVIRLFLLPLVIIMLLKLLPLPPAEQTEPRHTGIFQDLAEAFINGPTRLTPTVIPKQK